MIISASRRTDLPAFFTPWLLERVRAGWCEVANPFRPAQVTRVSLRPEDVDAIVFFTRDAGPLLPHLAELEARGLRSCLHYTLTGYPRELEPFTPSVDRALATLHRLAAVVGADRVLWRYDPIHFSARTPPDYHVEQFGRLAEALRGLTHRVTVSLLDAYPRVSARLRRLAAAGFAPTEAATDSAAVAGCLRALARTAQACGMEIVSCAEAETMAAHGITPGRCIDPALLRRLFGIDVPTRKDPGQRPACGCAVSRDIGRYGTCRHGCVYCYAMRTG